MDLHMQINCTGTQTFPPVVKNMKKYSVLFLKSAEVIRFAPNYAVCIK